MDNVYDLVADFYDNDEGWNQVLGREYAEGFLRHKAWHGVGDSDLKRDWLHILMLCIYLGHCDRCLGDLTADDIIDAVAWCGRNVADFSVDYASVKEFLDILGELFVFLKEKHAITSSLAPHLAKSQLLKDDGTLGIIDADGDFLPGEELRKNTATPNSPNKIFLNVGEAMGELLQELHSFFQQDAFNLDLERAVFFYQGFTKSEKKMEEAESEEFWQTFWDYFLFDYHLLLDDKTPLKHFSQKGITKYRPLVLELCRSRLALFSVEGTDDGEIYQCRDFLTDEEYSLNLPLSPDMDTKDMLILGHIFYNKTMVMNYVRCFKITKLGQKRLQDQLMSFYKWYKLQEPEGTMESFIARHPMVIRRAIYFAAHYLPMTAFPYTTQVTGYKPPVIRGGRDRIVTCVEKMMTPQHFSCRDVVLCMRMWLDFVAADGKVNAEVPEVWASGIIENYIRLNKAYSYSAQSVANICWHMSVTDLERAAAKVKETLRLEVFDPRYCNEEGVLTMLLNEGDL